MKEELRRRLFEAFSLESRDHLARIRSALQELSTTGSVSRDGLTSLHTLKGSARAIGLEPLEHICHRVEGILQRITRGELRVDADVVERLNPTPDLLEDVVAAFLGQRAQPDLMPFLTGLQALEGEGGGPELRPPTASAEVPTAALRAAARVSADELRSLLEASTRLVAETLQLEALTDNLRELARGHPELMAWRTQFEEISSSLQELANEVHQTTHQSLLAPAADLLGFLSSNVRELALREQKQVELEVEGMDTLVETPLLQSLADPLMHLVRNAVRHGIEPPEQRVAQGKSKSGKIRLSLRTRPKRLVVLVEDDGRGLSSSLERLRAANPDVPTPDLMEHLFAPGISTEERPDEVAGRGMGLTAVRQRVEQLGGSVDFMHAMVGTRVRMVVPTALAAQSVLLVRCDAQTLAIPSRSIRYLRLTRPQELSRFGDRVVLQEGDETIPVISLARRLGLAQRPGADPLKLVLLSRLALQVDDWTEHAEVVVRPIELPFGPYPHLIGAFARVTGDACLVLNPGWLLGSPLEMAGEDVEPTPTPRVLVVDDSVTTRTLAQGVLQGAGYDVLTANDGQEALDLLMEQAVDLVVSDVQMPRMDGLELVQRIKQRSNIPVILLTSRSEPAEQQMGLDLGADAYLVKQRFEQTELLRIVANLLAGA